MPENLKMLFLVALVLFTMQSLGGIFQIRNYRNAVKRMHKKGAIGIGQTRGRFLNGNLVIIACDRADTIIGAEVMEGLSFLARFRPKEEILGIRFEGTKVGELIEVFDAMPAKKQKRYRGYIHALNALQNRNREAREEAKEDAETDPAMAAAGL